MDFLDSIDVENLPAIDLKESQRVQDFHQTFNGTGIQMTNTLEGIDEGKSSIRIDTSDIRDVDEFEVVFPTDVIGEGYGERALIRYEFVPFFESGGPFCDLFCGS